MRKVNYGGGAGFFSLLTILFIYLKLTEKIDWSWWLVLSPLLVSTFLFILIILLFVLEAMLEEW